MPLRMADLPLSGPLFIQQESVCNVQGTVQDTGDTQVNKTDTIPALILVEETSARQCRSNTGTKPTSTTPSQKQHNGQIPFCSTKRPYPQFSYYIYRTRSSSHMTISSKAPESETYTFPFCCLLSSYPHSVLEFSLCLSHTTDQNTKGQTIPQIHQV